MQTTRVTRRRARLPLAAVLAFVVAVTTACGGGAGGADGSKSFTLADGAQNLSAFNAPYDVFAKDGYWKDAGLEVTPQFTQGGTQSAQLVASGKADISVVGLSSALQVAAQSPNLKIVGITGGNIWKMAVPEGSDVQSLDDLKGKTIGVQALNTGMYLYNRAALEIDGVDPDEDVKWLPIGTGAQAAAALDSGEVDAFATYYGPYEVVAGLTKEPMRLLPTPLDELDGSGAWIVNAKVLKEDRESVVELMRGMSKTAIWAQENPEAIIQALWDEDPATKPRGQSDEEAMASTVDLVANYWGQVINAGGDGMYGVLSDEAVKKAVDFHFDKGIVEGTFDIAKSVDLSVSRDADDYDKAEVEAEAAKQ
ncbi:ABC transporter substrate-binding protein [Aeromicrobium sp. Leaf291]|uniref:ABC transporter substrate-binding protein n=1 Tax=Aeromicrobium sp. Leaf291 TaxID=1736325 RepID=UPI0009EB94E7|nr:ABC transporter substrate-binding protein [Aeromicrobium sp. Leaf291]